MYLAQAVHEKEVDEWQRREKKKAPLLTAAQLRAIGELDAQVRPCNFISNFISNFMSNFMSNSELARCAGTAV